MGKELTLVNMLRVGDKRIAIVEYDTSEGKFYGAHNLYRSKEVAIQQARKAMQK